MNQDDWAIIVGICLYPELSHLKGPENDARAFHAWLIDPSGGAVPPSNTRLIVSSDFHPTPYGPATTAAGAMPQPHHIGDAFDQLQDLHLKRVGASLGSRVGRRLYLYFAGHGFSPRQDNAAMNGSDPALLAANATKLRLLYHTPVPSYANWFRKAGCFDEVLLFMDCCRNDYQQVQRNPIYADKTHPQAKNSRYFTAYATKWSGKTREKPMADGKVGGIFTTALLAGLKGAASMPNGDITDASLGNYLCDNMRSYLTETERKDPQIPQKPDVVYDTDPEARFVIARVPPSGPPLALVWIHVKPDDLGKTAQICGGDLEPVQAGMVDQSPWRVPLPRGLYTCKVGEEGPEVSFSVKGIGDVDVQL